MLLKTASGLENAGKRVNGATPELLIYGLF